jgi:hypothetical protein
MRAQSLGMLLLAVLSLLPTAWAQRKTDPLTSDEVDQVREATEEPDKRLKLFITFARQRLASLDEARSDPKATDRGGLTHDWLQDFLSIYDELNDNIDMYAERKEDLRKTLKAVIEADTEFQAKLLALKDAAGVPPEESKHYEFVLTSALESLDSSLEDHRQLIVQQEQEAKEKKKRAKAKH